VLDDPEAAAPSVAHATDDEGIRVSRRWLLRDGVVEQPLADSRWSGDSGTLAPGAARRGCRHELPGPRSTCLELLAGEASFDELVAGAEGGLYVAEISRGRLDPLTGRFWLEAPYGRRIRSGAVADPVGAFRVTGSVAELLAAIDGIGHELVEAGAGWCAKGGSKMPVWARVPALRLAGVEILPGEVMT
jgi:predicted Zn-dependent protease